MLVHNEAMDEEVKTPSPSVHNENDNNEDQSFMEWTTPSQPSP